MCRSSSKPVGNFLLNEGSEQAKGLRLWSPKANGRDYSPFANDGALTGFANPSTVLSGPAPGKDGGKDALAFDGVNDYVSLSPIIPLNSIPFSVSVWFKWKQSAGMLWEQMYAPSNEIYGNYIAIDISGNISVATQSVLTIGAATWGAPIAANVWTNVTGVWLSLSHRMVFVNGQGPVVDTTTLPATPGGSNFNHRFGVSGSLNFFSWFNGSLEDLRIANIAYSPSLINDIGGPDPRKRWELRYVPGKIVYFLPQRTSTFNWMFS